MDLVKAWGRDFLVRGRGGAIFGCEICIGWSWRYLILLGV